MRLLSQDHLHSSTLGRGFERNGLPDFNDYPLLQIQLVYLGDRWEETSEDQ